MSVFINLPTGSDGRDEVSINVTEIASYRGHVVTSYSYVDYTEVVLKNGVTHDCRISKAKFEERLRVALDVTDGAA
jgi:hypothetical protein